MPTITKITSANRSNRCALITSPPSDGKYNILWGTQDKTLGASYLLSFIRERECRAQGHRAMPRPVKSTVGPGSLDLAAIQRRNSGCQEICVLPNEDAITGRQRFCSRFWSARPDMEAT